MSSLQNELTRLINTVEGLADTERAKIDAAVARFDSSAGAFLYGGATVMTVGPTGDYAELADAVASLSRRVMNAPVAIEIEDGVHNMERVKEVYGVGQGSNMSLTIRSQSGNRDDCVLVFDNTFAGSCMYFDGDFSVNLYNVTVRGSSATPYKGSNAVYASAGQFRENGVSFENWDNGVFADNQAYISNYSGGSSDDVVPKFRNVCTAFYVINGSRNYMAETGIDYVGPGVAPDYTMDMINSSGVVAQYSTYCVRTHTSGTISNAFGTASNVSAAIHVNSGSYSTSGMNINNAKYCVYTTNGLCRLAPPSGETMTWTNTSYRGIYANSSSIDIGGDFLMSGVGDMGIVAVNGSRVSAGVGLTIEDVTSYAAYAFDFSFINLPSLVTNNVNGGGDVHTPTASGIVGNRGSIVNS